MTCANCARHVTEAIQDVSGVRSATVSLEQKNAVVHWNSGAAANVSTVIAAIKNAGYDAKEIQDHSCGCHTCHEPAKKNWRLNLWPGIVVTAFLMTGEWVFNFGMARWFQWLSFAL